MRTAARRRGLRMAHNFSKIEVLGRWGRGRYLSAESWFGHFSRPLSQMGNFCSDNDLADLRDGIAESMSRGLHTKDASTIKMLPSFVENLPSKDGNSTYVALDLGGTNFRVLLINIVDDNIDMDSQIYSVPQRNRSRNRQVSPMTSVIP